MSEYVWFLIIPVTMVFITFLAMIGLKIRMVMAVAIYFIFGYIQIGFFGIDQTQAVINSINYTLPIYVYMLLTARFKADWPIILAKEIWKSHKNKKQGTPNAV